MNGDTAISVPMTCYNNVPRTCKDIAEVLHNISFSECCLVISIISSYHCHKHQPDFHSSYFVLYFFQTVDVYRVQSAKEARQKEITGEFWTRLWNLLSNSRLSDEPEPNEHHNVKY